MAAHLRRNVAVFVTGEGFSGFGQNLVAPMTVLAVLLHKHGATPMMIGALMTIQVGASVLLQALGVYLFRSTRRRKVNLVLWYVSICPVYFVMAAIVYWWEALGSGAVRWGLPCCFLAIALAGGTAQSVWMDWVAHLFEQRLRGRAFGLMHGFSNLTSASAAVLGGAVLSAYPGSNGFAILYVAAGLILLVGNSVYLAVHDPAQKVQEVLKRTGFVEMLSLFGHSLRERNFRSFLIGRLLAMLGFSILPFIIMYYKQPLGGELPEARIIQFSAGQWIVSSVALIGAGWLGDRWGHRYGILLGTSMQVLVLALLVSTAGPWSCIAVYAISGICYGANLVSHYNLLCETCPHDNRKAHLTVGNLAMLPVALVAPILAGMLYDFYGVRALMWVSLVISAAAALWFLFRLKEPRTVPLFPDQA